MRNRMHDELSARFPDNPEPWFKQAGIFENAKGPTSVAEAVARLGDSATTARILASLPFGFWNGLLTRHYEKLWRSCLHRCFPAARGRRQVVEVVERLRLFRNRLAHHERLMHLDLATRHDDLLNLAMWIDEDCRAWIAAQSRVPELLNDRPR